MIAVAALPILFSYSLGSSPLQYQLKIDFDGYLPVFGGMQQKARVEFEMSVTPEPSIGTLKAKTSLKNLTLSLLDVSTNKYEPFNIGLSAVKEYFPDSTIVYLPNGEVKSTTAPAFNLPVRLPGLHTQHLPEVSFLPVVFPAAGCEPNLPFKFDRKFGDSSVATTATYLGKEDTLDQFSVAVSQAYDTIEDEYKNPITDNTKAKTRVATKVTGEGKVWFSGSNGSVVRSKMSAKAISAVYSVAGTATGETRELRITFQLERKYL